MMLTMTMMTTVMMMILLLSFGYIRYLQLASNSKRNGLLELHCLHSIFPSSGNSSFQWPWWYLFYWPIKKMTMMMLNILMRRHRYHYLATFSKTFEFCRMLNNFHKKSFIGRCFVFLGIFLWDHISHRNIERQYWQYSVVAVREVQKSKIVLCLRWWTVMLFCDWEDETVLLVCNCM